MLFLLVFTLAAFFRLTNLDLIEFKIDEGINLFLSSRLFFGHPLPPGGTVSSIGLLNPPFFNHLLAPLAFITLDPKTISFFIGLLNSLAISFFFLFAKRYYGLKIALVASILFALSPWAIIFSRKIWTQDLILPFLIIFLYSLHKIILEGKTKFWAPFVASGLFILQLHQTTFFFLFLITLFLLTKKVKLDPTYMTIGFLIGILPAIPYLFYIAKNISLDPQAFLVSKERFGQGYFLPIFFRPFQITSQGNFHFLLGEDMLTFAEKFPTVFQLRKLFYLEYLLLPFGVFVFWKNFPKLRFLIFATLGLPFIYFFLHFEPFIHYFIILAPLLFLFLATGLVHLLHLPNYFLKNISLLIFLILIGVSVAFNTAFFTLLKEKKVLKGDYGTAFSITEQNTQKSFQKYEKDPYYREMIITSWVSKNLIYGNLPLGKMLYPPEKTQSHLVSLEQRLKEVPEDPRVQNELLAFYTTPPLTPEVLKSLKEKSQEIPGYKPIYDEVSKLFVSQSP